VVNFLNNVAPPIGTKNRGRTHRGNKISAECRAFFFQLSEQAKSGHVENVFRRKFDSSKFVLSQFFYYFRTKSTKNIHDKHKKRHAKAKNNEVHI